MDKDNQESQVSGNSATMAESRAHPSAGFSPKGLSIASEFCPESAESPLDTVEWELRTAAIKGENGEVVFQQRDCEIPASWSQLATNVVVSKYFYGELGTGEREKSVRALVHRVTRTIADWGIQDGYFASAEDGERFYRELAWLCLHQHISFNSPVWFNVGLFHQYQVQGAMCNWYWDRTAGHAKQPENPYEYPQASACFIQSVQDNMEDIMELARSEAMLFKFGSGTGTDLSTLRSHREKLSGGGKPSGPLSFMRVYDQIAAVVKSGGKTRRAAKMQSLKVWHPDILEFIECKGKEESKARVLTAKGYDPDEAYSSVLFQNANLSIRVTDEFMQAVEADRPWTTHWVTDPNRDGPTYSAKEMFVKMAAAAWSCGDPGVQYDSTINRWHTCPKSGRINASNPCSEYMFLDDSACNLASVNLMKFRREDGTFDAERFMTACRLVFVAQEILVDHASYPTARITTNSHRFRPLGLGYSNLGSLIMASGLPYDSDAARGLASVVTAMLHGTACRTSTELAAAVGTFDGFDENRAAMLRVMEMHWEKVEQIRDCPDYLKSSARKVWDDVLAAGRRYGFRNAQATVLAPTGTISFMMDCDTTGIEPDIALVKYKQLAGGGMMKIVNQTVPAALKKLGYTEAEIAAVIAHIDKKDTIEGAPGLKPGALAGVRLRVPAAQRHAVHSVEGPCADDGRRAAVHLGGDLQNGEPAAGLYRAGRCRRVHGRLAAGPEGPGGLPRRLEGEPAAVDQERRQGNREAGLLAAARASARHPQVDHAQVQHQRARGVHHRRSVSRRPAGRALHHHGQGREHHRRPDGLLRHGGFDEPAVRRAARGVRQQVLAHPVRADGLHEESRYPHRQEHCGLHLPLAGHHVHAGLPRGKQGPGESGRQVQDATGRCGTRSQARRHDGRRAEFRARTGRPKLDHLAQWFRPSLGQRLSQRAGQTMVQPTGRPVVTPTDRSTASRRRPPRPAQPPPWRRSVPV